MVAILYKHPAYNSPNALRNTQLFFFLPLARLACQANRSGSSATAQALFASAPV
jgi:hypothetical protein